MTMLLLSVLTASVVWAALIVRRLNDEIEREADRAQRLTEMLEIAHAQLRDLKPREEQLRRAIWFYSNEESWVASGRSHSPAFHDRGQIARAALRGEA